MKFNLHMLIHIYYAVLINKIEINININNLNALKYEI